MKPPIMKPRSFIFFSICLYIIFNCNPYLQFTCLTQSKVQNRIYHQEGKIKAMLPHNLISHSLYDEEKSVVYSDLLKTQLSIKQKNYGLFQS